MPIQPYNDCVLVELQSSYKHAVGGDERRGDTKKNGLCIALSKDTAESDKILLGKTVYFDEFEDTTSYDIDGKKYALIKIENIKGYDK
jgi:co-chaperonin GroES (HSP10)